jgi:TRAP-type transport system periplasmic protein
LVLMLSAIPGTGIPAALASDTVVLKVAMLVPRSPRGVLAHKRYNSELAKATDGKVQTRIYWGGVAGDEKDVLRKMRVGQIDGGPFGLETMSQIVRQALVLGSPGLYRNHRQLDAVIEELAPEFNEEAYRNGFKVMGWGDIGKLLGDFRRVRPWLYPESQALAELYRLIGATGVPLGLTEVYGGLQTKMIDTVWATALLHMAMQWHTSTRYVSREGLGFISGAFVFRREAWESIAPEHREAMLQLTQRDQRKYQTDMRKADEDAFQKLLTRGHEAVEGKDRHEWIQAGETLRRKMIGRIYTKELVERAEKIAKRYADPEQKARLSAN